MGDPWSETELRRVTAWAREGKLDPDEVAALCAEVRRLRREYDVLSQQLQLESEDRQAYAFNAQYWEEHCALLTAAREAA